MKNLKIINSDKYEELLDMDMINPVPGKAFMFTHNEFLNKHLIKTRRIGILHAERENEKAYLQREKHNQLAMEYENIYGTTKDFVWPEIDTFVRKVYDHSQVLTLKTPFFNLPIEFCSPYNTVDDFCREVNEGWTDKRCEILLVNPLLYRYRYRTLSVANIFKGNDNTEVIYSKAARVNKWFIDNMGEPLFFILPNN